MATIVDSDSSPFHFGDRCSAAALVIISVFIVTVIALIILIAPFFGAEIAAFLDDFPAYVRRATDPALPWLRKIVGEGFGIAEQSSGDIASLSAGWLTDSLDRLLSVGRACCRPSPSWW